MALAGLLVFVAGLCLGPMQETDLFFRLASGEQFLRTGALVHHNLFSFTYPDAPYLDSAWLFDTAAALVFRDGRISCRGDRQDPGGLVDRGCRVWHLPPPGRLSLRLGAGARARLSVHARAAGRASAHFLAAERDGGAVVSSIHRKRRPPRLAAFSSGCPLGEPARRRLSRRGATLAGGRRGLS